MKNKILIAFFTFSLFIGCRSQQPQISQIREIQPKTENVSVSIREYSVQAVLWQQNAAEYRALTYQAFNLAKLRLDIILKNNKKPTKPLAIITDIDETILDNSPYSGKQIQLDEAFSKSRWLKWGKEKKAKAIPGALNFFNYAKSKGVEVFYISNRLSIQKKETIENLVLLGFPFADEAHVLLKEHSSGKEPRRSIVKKSHEILLLLGDNLSDFSAVFDNKSTTERNQRADSLKVVFGKKFIVLPNPMYGDWETKGILEGNYNWTSFQKDSIRHSKINSY